jgi:hypothetical protein
VGAYRTYAVDESELVADLIGKWQMLFAERGTWNTHWTEIAQRIYPQHIYMFQNFSFTNSFNQGDKRNAELYDSTGLVALSRFGAIMDSLLTPRNHFWHHIRPDDETLMRDTATRNWFHEANNILFKQRYHPNANFSSQNQLVYKSLGAYGTGLLFIDRLFGQKGLRYLNVNLGEVYLQENHQRLVDGVCRHFMLRARQAVQRFGGKCPNSIIEAAAKSPEREFQFLHWVLPRKDRDPFRKDFKGMEYGSYYISIQEHTLLEEGGFRTFPYSTPRYEQAPNEAYGRSPAMDVLPSIKTLNEQKKAMLKQGHRVTDPVLLMHDDGVLDAFDLTPGTSIPGGVTADGRVLIHPLPVGNIQAGKEMMDEEKALINDTFMISLFQVLTESPEMTATEVAEKVREKGILIAPTVGRQESEYLGPVVHRELDVLSSMDMLPPMPRMLREAKGEYKIVFDSPISRTQKSEWSSGALRTIESLTQVAQATGDSSVLDYINWDEAAPAIADINGTPAPWINSKEDIQRIRQFRAHQQAVNQTIQALPAMVGAQTANGPAAPSGPAQAPGLPGPGPGPQIAPGSGAPSGRGGQAFPMPRVSGKKL